MPPIPASILLPLSSLQNTPVAHAQNAIHPSIPRPINLNIDNLHILEPRRGGGAKGGGGGGSSGGGKSKGGAAVGGSKITTTQIIIISVCCSLAAGLFYLVLYLWVKKPWRLLSKKRVEQARRQQAVLDAAFAKKPKDVPPHTATPAPMAVAVAEPAPIYTPTPTPGPAPAAYTNRNLDRGDGQNGIFIDSISPAPAGTPPGWGNEPEHGVIAAAAPAPAYVGYTPAPNAPVDRKETWAERWLPGWK